MLVPSTLKPEGKLHGQDIIVLMDGGSTNNFIQTRWATHLSLTVQPCNSMKITVGNDTKIQSSSICTQVPLQLSAAVFMVDLLLLPVFFAYVVLGVHWLRSLGPTLFDYHHLWIEFDYQGLRVRLLGLRNPHAFPTSTVAFKRHVHHQPQSQYSHLSVSLDSNPITGLSTSPNHLETSPPPEFIP